MRGMPDAATTYYIVEAAGQVYRLAHDFAYFWGNINHDGVMSIEVDRRIYNGLYSLSYNLFTRYIG